ncbi:glutaredoxin domain-containing protein [Microbacterium sp. Bi128]|uniref:glutaredoxin family protein n=1 Tax=Microbacterium sp. Bi128 TaxID=2821115 RepID=UPI001DBBAFE6|nr:glutaredoxin domain-containing protein [Microbacterium sp. Bi128]CAH0235534.1 hypothetical protein SRABI128_02545 [Microbacterium sp. Bi128]
MSAPDEVTVYGRQDCADTLRTRALLQDADVPYVFVDVEASASDAARAAALGGSSKVPVVVLPGGAVLVEPPDTALRAHLSL